jgi:hypothetical protein
MHEYQKYIDLILERFHSIDWEGPATFVVLFLALLAYFKKYIIILFITLTFVIAWGAKDLIITNRETSDQVFSIPLLIYSVGGGVVIILLLYSFYKSK